MCDEATRQQAQQFTKGTSPSNNRTENLTLPVLADALDIKAQNIDINTPDGTADCYFVYPTEGKHAAVLIWSDILGIRKSFRLMADRLAQSGYTVLVVNPYYRVARGAIVPEGSDFTQPGIPEIVIPLAMTLSSETCLKDGRAFVEFLDQQPAVDTHRKMASTGYCMTGSYPLRIAADMPERFGACVSFHGNDMVTDTEDSPHLIAKDIQADVLIIIAENDDEAAPQTKTLLRDGFKNTKGQVNIEVYKDTLHGFCPPDSLVHNQEQAEKAWHRQLSLFAKQL
jgi:carboxymethylenebutenolidase